MTIDNPNDTFAVAGIGPKRQGAERFRTLSEGERAFYRRILRSFGAGRPPGPDALADAASELDLEVEPTLELLARADLVHQDPATGAIVVAYPFSGRPTAHRVHIGNDEVYAMCAIDALGIAPMLGEPIGTTRAIR
ncbi:MAG: organomercurial lyase [Candidatus Rokuibacteriota bacterium]